MTKNEGEKIELISTPKTTKSNYLGVNIRCNNNRLLENLIKESLDKVCNKGYILPDEIIVDNQHFKNIFKDKDELYNLTAGHFEINNSQKEIKTVIYLNDDYNWQKPNKKGSTDSLCHPIIHEMGHCAHYNENPIRFLRLSTDLPESVTDKVSPYAKVNNKEFIAEVFVMKVLDKKIDLRVENYFRSYDGPDRNKKSKDAERAANWGSDTDILL